MEATIQESKSNGQGCGEWWVSVRSFVGMSRIEGFPGMMEEQKLKNMKGWEP